MASHDDQQELQRVQTQFEQAVNDLLATKQDLVPFPVQDFRAFRTELTAWISTELLEKLRPVRIGIRIPP